MKPFEIYVTALGIFILTYTVVKAIHFYRNELRRIQAESNRQKDDSSTTVKGNSECRKIKEKDDVLWTEACQFQAVGMLLDERAGNHGDPHKPEEYQRKLQDSGGNEAFKSLLRRSISAYKNAQG